MSKNEHKIELETRTIGVLVLTTPVLQKLLSDSPSILAYKEAKASRK